MYETTSSGVYSADKLLLSAGAWNAELIRDLSLPLVVERQSVFWLDPERDSSQYELGRLPIYAYEYRAGNICYGFPRLPRGVKASVMHDGESVPDPETVNRVVGPAEVNPLRAALRPILPALAEAPSVRGRLSLHQHSDHDFIIDFHPSLPQLLISSACSGHGFSSRARSGDQADLLTPGSQPRSVAFSY